MYQHLSLAPERQRELRAEAAALRQRAHLRALRKASRRAQRAERQLVAAQCAVLRARSELVGGA